MPVTENPARRKLDCQRKSDIAQGQRHQSAPRGRRSWRSVLLQSSRKNSPLATISAGPARCASAPFPDKTEIACGCLHSNRTRDQIHGRSLRLRRPSNRFQNSSFRRRLAQKIVLRSACGPAFRTKETFVRFGKPRSRFDLRSELLPIRRELVNENHALRIADIQNRDVQDLGPQSERAHMLSIVRSAHIHLEQVAIVLAGEQASDRFRPAPVTIETFRIAVSRVNQECRGAACSVARHLQPRCHRN